MAVFERDPAREGELFLRLPAPLAHIILTPPRKSDVPALVAYMNDFEVAKQLTGPPYPYTAKDSDEFYPMIAKECEDAARQYEAMVAGNEGSKRWLDALPIRAIRDTNAANHQWNDGGQLFIGDIGLRRATFPQVLDVKERKRLKEENDAYEAGDERIQWEFGGNCVKYHWVLLLLKRADFLTPSHWGKRIMSSAVKAVIEAGTKYLNAQMIQIHYFSENIASRKVFEKSGFVDFDFVPNAITMPECKGGRVVDLGVMRWYRPRT
jgi:RimJ/RimL family protein N-acetyltransferase